jgi:hypothetical protein
MEESTLAFLAELYQLYIEHIKTHPLFERHNIFVYYGYADNVLVVYNSQTINIDSSLADFDSVHS